MAAAVRDRSPAPFGAELVGDALAGGEVAVQDPDLVSDGVLHGSSQELAVSYQCPGLGQVKDKQAQVSNALLI